MWVRNLCRSLAKENKGVLVFQPPVMSEVEHTIDDVVVIGKGKIIKTGSLSEVLKRSVDCKCSRIQGWKFACIRRWKLINILKSEFKKAGLVFNAGRLLQC